MTSDVVSIQVLDRHPPRGMSPPPLTALDVRVSVVIPTLNEARKPAARVRAAPGRTSTSSSSSTATPWTTRSRSRVRCDPMRASSCRPVAGRGMPSDRVRGLHRRHHRDDRRRRVDGRRGDPAVRRRAVQRGRLREGLAVRAGRGQRRHHPAAACRQPRAQRARSTRSTARATRTSVTATTRSGPGACRTCASTARVRGRDADQHPDREGGARRSTRCRAASASGSTGRATCTRSATARASCARSRASASPRERARSRVS